MRPTRQGLLLLLPLALFYVSLFWGRYPIEPLTVLQVLASRVAPIPATWPPTVETVIVDVRLPRTLLAMLVGAGLSITGAAFQGMFRNPLVSPDILGVSAAAGFGASVAILLSANALIIQLAAFGVGLLGVALTYGISRVYKTTPAIMLVLSGVVVAAFFGALVSGTKYVADPEQKLPAITFWLLGSLASASWASVVTVLPLMAIGTGALLLVRWRINVLSMGDEEARALGVRTEVLKGIIIVAATVVTAVAVSVSGIIGWVGLIIPHLARMLVGPDHRALLPASLALGAVYLLLIDDIARTATAAEIPLGILTAVVGAPVFAYLLRRTKGAWS